MTRKGEHHTEETKQKIRESAKETPCETRFKKGHQNGVGKKLSVAHKQNLSISHKGKPTWNKGKTGIYSLEVLKQMSESHLGQIPWNKGTPQSEEACRKMSEFQKVRMQKPEERKKRSEQLTGLVRSKESREKQSMTLKGHPVSLETREKMSKSRTGKKHPGLSKKRMGEGNPAWKGGVSFEPYCILFNKEFRERVRAFFGYQCMECGTPENKRKLTVHHVNYDKLACCNDNKPSFACLCASCNSKANSKREYWEQHFTDMINNYYGGKCYFSKEEMKILKETILVVSTGYA